MHQNLLLSEAYINGSSFILLRATCIIITTCSQMSFKKTHSESYIHALCIPPPLLPNIMLT